MESEIQAWAQFPELFASSPAQTVRRTESENDAARSGAELVDEIESVEDPVEEAVVEADPSLHPEDPALTEAETRCKWDVR